MAISLLVIYGASDDLVEFEGPCRAFDKSGDHGQDHDGYPQGGPNAAEFPVDGRQPWEFVIEDRLHVLVFYTSTGEWAFAPYFPEGKVED